jgi:hypothetical protein
MNLSDTIHQTTEDNMPELKCLRCGTPCHSELCATCKAAKEREEEEKRKESYEKSRIEAQKDHRK